MIVDFFQADLSGKQVFVRAKFKPPFKTTVYMESEACLMYNVKGPGYVYGADKTEMVAEQESALMKCGNFIGDWKATSKEALFDVITIHFFPEVIQEVFENNMPEYLTKPVNHSRRVFQKIEANAILKSYIDSLLIYFDNPELFNNDTIKLKLKELIALLYQLDSHGVREILSDLFNPHDVDFKKVVAAHLFHNLSLEEFAALQHQSVSTFKRRFKEIYQASPGQYITTKKLEKAAHLLANTSQRIGEVCYDCGFGDVSNFTKAFKAHYGVTPSAYQKAQSR